MLSKVLIVNRLTYEALPTQVKPHMLESLAILSARAVKKICSLMRKPETTLEIREQITFLKLDNKPLIYKLFKDFVN